MRTINTAVHNRFDIEVRDAKTGELKQSCTCYNIILNSFFTKLVNRSSKLGYIHLGTGTGTPTVTRTSLFTFKVAREATTVQTRKAYPTSYVRKSITLSPADCVDCLFTEVGFGSGTSSTTLVTHSMLQDAEGNQIAIRKTDTDVLTVYATFFCTITADASEEVVLPSLANNAIIPAIISDSYSFGELHLSGESPLQYSDDIWKSSMATRSFSITGDTTNYQWVIKATRLNYNEGNSHMFSSIGIPKIAAWVLPNSTVFPNVSLTDIPVGTGDGVTTGFHVPIPLIVAGSERIRVDGVTLERGTDYTINYRQPDENYLELLPCADASRMTLSGGLHNASYEGMMCWYDDDNPNGVGPNNPLIFDFGSVQPFNRIVARENWMYAGTWQGYAAIDYSVDGENWTTVYSGYSRSENGRQPINMTLSTPVQARYWRFRVTNISWSYDIAHYGSTWPNIGIWYEEPGLVFANPPADGAAIEMDCVIDRPIKNENWVLDFTCAVQFTRG